MGDGPQSQKGIRIRSDRQHHVARMTEHPSTRSGSKGRMDEIAKYLVFLRDEGVEVMFRPLREMN
jgi:hypothetical protein